MATLKDVAQKACVDVSTVSRALNNTSYVHPETKARIVATAKELGYRPNVMAKALRQGRRHTLGVIVPRLHLTLFSEILPGIEHEAERLGYSTLISTTDDDPQREKSCLERMQNSFVDGIIITGTGRNNRLLRSIQASGIAVTQIVRCQEPRISSRLRSLRPERRRLSLFQRLPPHRAHRRLLPPKPLQGPVRGLLQGHRRPRTGRDPCRIHPAGQQL